MDRDKIIELVNRSPELVGKHDREGWLNLFSSNAVVQDPVGAGPNRKGKDMRKGKDALGRFYDIFIGPNMIKFDVHQDVVVGDEMVREVSIHTTLSNGAITIVHIFLIYKAVEENGELKIESLRAHWNFGKNAVSLMTKNGLKGMTGSTMQFYTMIKVQGMKRIIEYLGAMYKGILGKGIKSANAFAAAVSAGDQAALSGLCDASATIEFPAGNSIPSGEFLSGAGKDVKLEITGVRSGGWYTSGAIDIKGSGGDRHGVVFFEFNPATKKIAGAQFFWN
ncbi:MAG: nuclear transport factor 2 family protein [Chloroflexota bacterium]|nr:nuclear transport factor 2 family protein [Chloroflexota bacterium]